MDNHLYIECDGILQGLVVVLDELMCLLKEEREAILEFNLEKITSITRKKNDLLLKTKVLESSKSSVFQKMASALGCQSKPSTEFIIERLPDQSIAEKLRNKLSCIKSLAQALQEFNELQRHYISSSLSTVQSSLAILGQFSQEGNCYNDKAGMTSQTKTSMRGVMNQSV